MAAHSALQRTSQRNRAAFEAHEKEFQDYRILPDVNRPTIAPDKVLDME